MRNARKTHWRWAALSLGLGLAGCRLLDARDDLNNILGDPCRLDSDCEGDFVCIFDYCHEECRADEDCPNLERCVLGSGALNVCQLPNQTTCEMDLAACKGAQVCAVDLECHDPCVFDADCPHAQQRCDQTSVCVSTVGKDPLDPNGNLVPHPGGTTSESSTTSDPDTTTSSSTSGTSSGDSTSTSTSGTSSGDSTSTGTSSSTSASSTSTSTESSGVVDATSSESTESTEATSEPVGSSSESDTVEPSGCPFEVELTFGEELRGSTADPGWDIDLSDWMDRSDVACDPFPADYPGPYQVYAFDLPAPNVWDIVVTPDPGVDVSVIAWREGLGECLPEENGSTLVCEVAGRVGASEPEIVYYLVALTVPYRFGVLVTAPPEGQRGGYSIRLQVAE